MSALVDGPDMILIDGLAVRCFGDPDHPAVVFSAGLGGSGLYWMPQVEAIARDHRVILYDHRGTGGSAREPLPDPYGADHMADDIRRVLDGLDIDRAHIVGHAGGGVAGLAFTRAWPDRARTLTIVNGWALADPHFIRCLEIRMAIFDAGGADAYLKAQPLFLYPAAWISEHLGRLDEERAAHAAGFQDRATLAARVGALRGFDARAWLADVGVPALVVVSADDMLVPARSSDLLAGVLPDATLSRMAWGGHAVNVTDPRRFDQVLASFLRDRRGA